MTREEIIEHLDSIVGTYEILLGHGVNSDILEVDDIEAIREAISALSAEGEYIKKEDAIAQAKASYRVAETIEELANLNEDNLNSLPTYSFPEREKGEWIPISSINEIPKKGAYWVTFEYENGYRETSHIGWDTFHEHWDDEEGWALDNEKYVIAYMPYFEPKPYNPNGE